MNPGPFSPESSPCHLSHHTSLRQTGKDVNLPNSLHEVGQRISGEREVLVPVALLDFVTQAFTSWTPATIGSGIPTAVPCSLIGKGLKTKFELVPHSRAQLMSEIPTSLKSGQWLIAQIVEQRANF